MKIKLFFCLAFTFTFFSCNNRPNYSLNRDVKKISIFRFPHNKENFFIKINNDFEFTDTTESIETDSQMWQNLTVYKTLKDSIVINLKVSGRDTLFKHKMEFDDSIILGLRFDTLMIINKKDFVWKLD
jgi:hypothetical protein